ncbi:MAG TPA: type II secretion system F family protein [Xanthobacteraceae bacterium]|nr:type II secretion system F family protein [Xanthobacteraceae bacterium]
MPIQQLAMFFLAAAAVGGIAWVFLYPLLSGERHAERRMQSVAKPDRVAKVSARAAPKVRRDQIEETLKQLEERRKKQKSPPLSVRIEQAGLTWSPRAFMIGSGVLGAIAFLAVLMVGGGLPAAAAMAFGASIGLPRWILSYLRKRRHTKFLENFPDAVDIIVRGIKAGLPLLDSMRVIVADAPEPIKSEFRAIIETQTIGLPLSEACLKLYERIPLAEANFFGIVVAIQQKAGGNLSEALGNLSKVLRDRKKMKAKIKAMSMEAKASAGIIGSLPIVVMTLVWLTSPDYIELLWTTSTGRLLLAGSGIWMFFGIMSMKKMINFDF